MKTKILIIIVGSNIFFIAGLLTGYYLYPRINYGSFDSSDALCIDTTHCMESEVYLTVNEANAFLEEVRETLGKKEVTFAQIIDLRTKYDEHSSEYLQLDKDSSVYKKLKDYVDLVHAIQTNNIIKARRGIATSSSILEFHAKLVRMLKEGQDYSDLKSFVDIQQTVAEPPTGEDKSKSQKSAATNERYTCSECGPHMYFNTQKELDDHIRKHHIIHSEREFR